MDSYLNILQSIQLPFALVPLLKFVGSEKIMGQFAVSKGQIWFASTFGTFLFLMNFVIIFLDATFDQWWKWALVVLFTVVYIAFIMIAILEPIKPLRKQTKAEMEDHEFDRIIVEDSGFSDTIETGSLANTI